MRRDSRGIRPLPRLRCTGFTLLCDYAMNFKNTTRVCIVALLAGCHSQPPLTPQQIEGKHFYQMRCAHCHEENDLALKKVPPDLHRLFKSPTLPSGAPASDAEIERVVLAGKGMMPAFSGRFTQDQMAALLSYLHTDLR